MSTAATLIGRGLRSAQPTPAAGAAGQLYYVTDELKLERWSGSAWEAVSVGVAADAIFNAAGDLVVGTGADTAARLAIGTSGYVLTSNGTTAAWAAASSGAVATDAIWDAAGDLALGTGANTAAKLAIGTSGYVLTSNGTTASWAAASGGSDPYADYAFTTLSGWTQFGSPDTCSVANFTNRLHLKKNATGSVALAGVYQAQPSYPFTLDLYVEDATPINSNYARIAGLFVAEASMAGKVLAIHANAQSSAYNHVEVASVQYTTITAYGSSPHSQGDTFMGRPPIFYRIVAASTSSVSLYYSYGGKVWRLLASAYDPGFTIGAIGMFVDPEQTGYAVEAVLGLNIS